MIFINDKFEALDSPAYLARQLSASALMGLLSIPSLALVYWVALNLIALLGIQLNASVTTAHLFIAAGVTMYVFLALPYAAPTFFIRLMFPNFAAAWYHRHGNYSLDFY